MIGAEVQGDPEEQAWTFLGPKTEKRKKEKKKKKSPSSESHKAEADYL